MIDFADLTLSHAESLVLVTIEKTASKYVRRFLDNPMKNYLDKYHFLSSIDIDSKISVSQNVIQKQTYQQNHSEKFEHT